MSHKKKNRAPAARANFASAEDKVNVNVEQNDDTTVTTVTTVTTITTDNTDAVAPTEEEVEAEELAATMAKLELDAKVKEELDAKAEVELADKADTPLPTAEALAAGETATTTVIEPNSDTTVTTAEEEKFPDTVEPKEANADVVANSATPEVIAETTGTGPKVGVTVLDGTEGTLPTEKEVPTYEQIQDEQILINEEAANRSGPRVGRTVPEHAPRDVEAHPNSPMSAQLPEVIVRMRAEAAAKALGTAPQS